VDTYSGVKSWRGAPSRHPPALQWPDKEETALLRRMMVRGLDPACCFALLNYATAGTCKVSLG
jgi:hypothetical protein